MDSGLNNIPVGEAVTRNFAAESRFAIFSVKHEPIRKIVCE
jgi:hypothetical protein